MNKAEIERFSTDEVVLDARGIIKRFGDVIACNAVDLTIHRGEIIALLGENGAGKTTLMNILFGHYTADEGEVRTADAKGDLIPLEAGSPMAALEAGIGMVHQHFTLADALSGLDNIRLGTESLWSGWQDTEATRFGIDTLMRESGLNADIAQPVSRLSVGERQRIEILKALYRGCHILVLDEPTAVLTPQDSEQLFKTLRHLSRQGVAIIFISHKLAEVRALADRIVILRNGKKVAEYDPRHVDNDQLAETMVGRLIDTPAKPALQAGETLLQLRNLTVKPGPSTGRHGLDQVNFEIKSHEIIGVAGVAGNGQQALSRLISGLVQPDSGDLSLFGVPAPHVDPKAMQKAGIGRIPEDRLSHGIVGEMAVWENLILERFVDDPRWNKGGLIQKEAASRYAADIVQRYRVRCGNVSDPAAMMSGGNIQKLILARIFEQTPRIILADQPTRGLDIGAVVYIHEQLLKARGRGAGIVLISEDLDEILTLADRVAVMFRGKLTATMDASLLDAKKLGLMMAGVDSKEAAYAS